MAAEHDTYVAEDLTAARPCANGVNEQVSYIRPTDAPELRHKGCEIRPPRSKFVIHDE